MRLLLIAVLTCFVGVLFVSRIGLYEPMRAPASDERAVSDPAESNGLWIDEGYVYADDIDTAINWIVNDANKRFPRQIDEFTRMISARRVGREIIYRVDISPNLLDAMSENQKERLWDIVEAEFLLRICGYKPNDDLFSSGVELSQHFFVEGNPLAVQKITADEQICRER